jgi:hypothetical protein
MVVTIRMNGIMAWTCMDMGMGRGLASADVGVLHLSFCCQFAVASCMASAISMVHGLLVEFVVDSMHACH